MGAVFECTGVCLAWPGGSPFTLLDYWLSHLAVTLCCCVVRAARGSAALTREGRCALSACWFRSISPACLASWTDAASSSCMGEAKGPRVFEFYTKSCHSMAWQQVASSPHTCLVAVRKAFFSESSASILAATSFSQPYNKALMILPNGVPQAIQCKRLNPCLGTDR